MPLACLCLPACAGSDQLDAACHRSRQARALFSRIAEFLGVTELQDVRHVRECFGQKDQCSVLITDHVSGSFSCENNTDRPSLKSIDLEVKSGEFVAICGEVLPGE